MKSSTNNSLFFLFFLTALVWGGVEALSQTCNNSAGLLTDPDDDVGIHTQYPDKPLHIFAPYDEDCNDPAIKLSTGQTEYAGYLSLLTSANVAFYTAIQNKSIGDLVLSADSLAGDLILTTHSHTGCIRFATTPVANQDDMERMTILPIGHVGIFEKDPKEPLQIGSRLTFHIGANNDFIGYNEYVDCYNDRRRMFGTPSSCLNFKSNGQIYLGAAGSGPAESEVSYVEAGGGISGITVSNSNSFGCIGVGAYGEVNNRLLIRGMGSTSATNAVKVTNSSGTTTLFIIRDDQRVGIGNGDPKDILHVGEEIVFHNGGSKDISINSYHDPAAGYPKNISSVRPSLLIGVDPPEGSDGAHIWIDKNSSAGQQLWQDYDTNGDMKGIKLLPTGFVGICQVTPTSTLDVRGFGNDETTSSFHVKNDDDASLLFVRDDGKVSISGDLALGGDLELDGKLMLGAKRVKAESDYYSDYYLSVDGTIITTELVISDKDVDWADFVFNDDYNLIPLDELEQSIKKNKRLPGIPTAEEISKKGFKVGEMQSKLLQKIEELTLYVIELKKEINQFKIKKGE